MRDPVSREASGDGVSGMIGEAAARLHQAVSRLESSVADRPGNVEAALVSALARVAEVEQACDRLSAELNGAQERERALEAAAAAASEALGRAASEVRAALYDGAVKGLGEEEAA